MLKQIITSFLLSFPLLASLNASAEQLTLYSGRSKALVTPLIEKFEKETGIKIKVRYGNTAQLTLALLEEGSKTPADLFWAQDVGALTHLQQHDLLQKLPEAINRDTIEELSSSQQNWIATSGRTRVLAYSSERVQPEELPKSIFELTDKKWQNRIGWAPTNASFQAFINVMRALHGEEISKVWLMAMKDNGTKAYPNNTSLLQATAAGEIDLSLNNHYYLLRLKEADSNYPVEQTTFAEKDAGNFVNVAGVGLLSASKKTDAATQFVNFLLAPEQQYFFSHNIKEYPVIENVASPAELANLDELARLSPEVKFDELTDLQGTLTLLNETVIR